MLKQCINFFEISKVLNRISNGGKHSLLTVIHSILIAITILSTIGCGESDQGNPKANTIWQCEQYGCSNQEGNGSASIVDYHPPQFLGIAAVAQVSTNSVKVTWNHATDDITEVENITYHVYASCTNPYPYLGLNYSPAPAVATVKGQNEVVIMVASNDQDCYFAVRATDGAKNQEYNQIIKTLRMPDNTPPIFAGVSEVAVTALNSLSIRWFNGADQKDSTNELTYLIYVTPSGQEINYSLPTCTTQGQPNYSFPGFLCGNLADDTAYQISVRARDTSGNIDENNIHTTIRTPVNLQLPGNPNPDGAAMVQTSDGSIFLGFLEKNPDLPVDPFYENGGIYGGKFGNQVRILRRSPAGIWHDLGAIAGCIDNCPVKDITSCYDACISIQMSDNGNSDGISLAISTGSMNILVWRYSQASGFTNLHFPPSISYEHPKIFTKYNTNQLVVAYQYAKIEYKKYVYGHWTEGSSKLESPSSDFSILPAPGDGSVYVTLHNGQKPKYCYWDLINGCALAGVLNDIGGLFELFPISWDTTTNAPLFLINDYVEQKIFVKKLSPNGSLEKISTLEKSESIDFVATNPANGNLYASMGGHGEKIIHVWDRSRWRQAFIANKTISMIPDIQGGVIALANNNSTNSSLTKLVKFY